MNHVDSITWLSLSLSPLCSGREKDSSFFNDLPAISTRFQVYSNELNNTQTQKKEIT